MSHRLWHLMKTLICGGDAIWKRLKNKQSWLRRRGRGGESNESHTSRGASISGCVAACWWRRGAYITGVAWRLPSTIVGAALFCAVLVLAAARLAWLVCGASASKKNKTPCGAFVALSRRHDAAAEWIGRRNEKKKEEKKKKGKKKKKSLWVWKELCVSLYHVTWSNERDMAMPSAAILPVATAEICMSSAWLAAAAGMA